MKKIQFIDYHGRRAGVFSTISDEIIRPTLEETMFYSGGLPEADGGAYKQESDQIVGKRYAEPFRGRLDEGLVNRILNTAVGPTNPEQVGNMDLVFPLSPHILQRMNEDGLPIENAVPLLRYLGNCNEWIDAPDYTLQRALADAGKAEKRKEYRYVSPITNKTALESSEDAFGLYAEDTIEIVNRLREKLRAD